MMTMALGSDPRFTTLIDGRYSETSMAWNTVASYDDYAGAQAAVDRLSDDGFPVEELSIVGSDLRLVEKVTGRLTKAKAALSGAASGAWFGLFVGLLLGLFTTGHGWLVMLLAGLGTGAAWGAMFGFLAHAATRGRRDFSAFRMLAAQRYDLISTPGQLERARIMLGQAGLLPRH
jgi:Heat induced stress protein YflT domain